MSEQDAIGRRTALRRFGAVAAAVTGASGTSAAAASTPEADVTTENAPVTGQARQRPPDERVIPDETAPESGLTGVYGGTVDRVVGGEHVVVLVETDEETVGQVIVSAAEFPLLAARDSVLVWLVFGDLVYLWPL